MDQTGTTTMIGFNRCNSTSNVNINAMSSQQQQQQQEEEEEDGESGRGDGSSGKIKRDDPATFSGPPCQKMGQPRFTNDRGSTVAHGRPHYGYDDDDDDENNSSSGNSKASSLGGQSGGYSGDCSSSNSDTSSLSSGGRNAKQLLMSCCHDEKKRRRKPNFHHHRHHHTASGGAHQGPHMDRSGGNDGGELMHQEGSSSTFPSSAAATADNVNNASPVTQSQPLEDPTVGYIAALAAAAKDAAGSGVDACFFRATPHSTTNGVDRPPQKQTEQHSRQHMQPQHQQSRNPLHSTKCVRYADEEPRHRALDKGKLEQMLGGGEEFHPLPQRSAYQASAMDQMGAPVPQKSLIHSHAPSATATQTGHHFHNPAAANPQRQKNHAPNSGSGASDGAHSGGTARSTGGSAGGGNSSSTIDLDAYADLLEACRPFFSDIVYYNARTTDQGGNGPSAPNRGDGGSDDRYHKESYYGPEAVNSYPGGDAGSPAQQPHHLLHNMPEGRIDEKMQGGVGAVSPRPHTVGRAQHMLQPHEHCRQQRRASASGAPQHQHHFHHHYHPQSLSMSPSVSRRVVLESSNAARSNGTGSGAGSGLTAGNKDKTSPRNKMKANNSSSATTSGNSSMESSWGGSSSSLGEGKVKIDKLQQQQQNNVTSTQLSNPAMDVMDGGETLKCDKPLRDQHHLTISEKMNRESRFTSTDSSSSSSSVASIDTVTTAAAVIAPSSSQTTRKSSTSTKRHKPSDCHHHSHASSSANDSGDGNKSSSTMSSLTVSEGYSSCAPAKLWGGTAAAAMESHADNNMGRGRLLPKVERMNQEVVVPRSNSNNGNSNSDSASQEVLGSGGSGSGSGSGAVVTASAHSTNNTSASGTAEWSWGSGGDNPSAQGNPDRQEADPSLKRKSGSGNDDCSGGEVSTLSSPRAMADPGGRDAAGGDREDDLNRTASKRRKTSHSNPGVSKQSFASRLGYEECVDSKMPSSDICNKGIAHQKNGPRVAGVAHTQVVDNHKSTLRCIISGLDVVASGNLRAAQRSESGMKANEVESNAVRNRSLKKDDGALAKNSDNGGRRVDFLRNDPQSAETQSGRLKSDSSVHAGTGVATGSLAGTSAYDASSQKRKSTSRVELPTSPSRQQREYSQEGNAKDGSTSSTARRAGRRRSTSEYEETDQGFFQDQPGPANMDTTASVEADGMLIPGKPVALDEVISFSNVARLVAQSAPPFHVVHANAAYTKLSGIDSHAAVGKPLSSLLISSSDVANPHDLPNARSRHHNRSLNTGRGTVKEYSALEQAMLLERIIATFHFGGFHEVKVKAGQGCDAMAGEGNDSASLLTCSMALSPVVSSTRTYVPPAAIIAPDVMGRGPETSYKSSGSGSIAGGVSKRQRRSSSGRQHSWGSVAERNQIIGANAITTNITHYLVQLVPGYSFGNESVSSEASISADGRMPVQRDDEEQIAEDVNVAVGSDGGDSGSSNRAHMLMVG